MKTDKELEQLQAGENYDVKYMSELRQYWMAYNDALINEIYAGVGINLGLSEKEAYDLARYRPDDMKKAKFFTNIFKRFKTIFKHKVPKFRYKKKLYGVGKPMTPAQWDVFSDAIDKYFKPKANKVAEDVAIKSYMLGRDTTSSREKKKPYKNKSLQQIEDDQFNGDMPDNIASAYKNYDFKNSEKKIINKSLSSIAMYVKQTDNTIQEAIRQQIQYGFDNDLSPQEVSSNLYWEVEKGPVNKYSAESMRKNWNRIASTEMASVYEAAILAPYESQAMESMKDPKKSQYFVRTGGSCEYCLALRGSIVRLIPSEIADTSTEKLSSIGIKDPNTNTYIYVGKNNIGRKRNEWQNCCPGHPHNVATFNPIDLEKEEYNQKTDDIKIKIKEDQYLPKQVDYDKKVKEEKEDRKPKKIGNNLVKMNNNVYIAVQPDEYNDKLEKWRKDPTKPIPVNINSPSYKRTFEVAE